ncbi:YceG family protein, partial [Bacillus mycoides]|uniref:YceG family protein n=1 Tax=Bacillus mycoides TaxID=1405 RepID=UPI003CC80917
MLQNPPHYQLTHNKIQFTYIPSRILPLPNHLHQYFNQFFHYTQPKPIHVLHQQNLNNLIHSHNLPHIQQLFILHHQPPNPLTLNPLLPHLSPKQFLPKLHNPHLHHYIHTTFIPLLKFYHKHHNQSLKTQPFRRFLIH